MIYVVCLLVSFCSISYQILISKALLQFSSDEVFSQSLTLGVYLLSIGVGAFVADKFFKRNRTIGFLTIEFLLSILGCLIVPAIYIITAIFIVFNHDQVLSVMMSPELNFRIVIFQVFTFVIGFITGFEVPLLNAIQKQKTNEDRLNTFLGLSYVGTVIGSFVIPLWIIPIADLISVGVLISFINIVCLVLASLFLTRTNSHKAITLLFMSLALLCNYAVLKAAPTVVQIYKKAFYLEVSYVDFDWNNLQQAYRLFSYLKPIEYYQTVYQTIDILPAEMAPKGTNIYDSFVQDFSLYLNTAPQFSASTYRFYHESMVEGAINLNGKAPEKVLILGGGDGLLAADLLKISSVKEITLVELDPKMIELANQHPVISELNKKALLDSRVKVVVGDAFHFIKYSSEKYDAILVDFPFPASYELGRLFSVEFYSQVMNLLRADGYVISDIPILTDKEARERKVSPLPQEIMVNTLLASGVQSYLVFGPIDGFIFAKKEKKDLKFDYNKLPDYLDFRTRLNLNVIELKDLSINPEFINSVYKPKRFRWR